MATTKDLMDALDKLTKPTNANKFPGMPSDRTIIENYIKKKYPAYPQFDTAAERKKFMDDTYKLVEQEVKMHIFTVKATYTGIKDGIKQVQATIKATIAGALQPSVLPNAGGPSVPNPLRTIQEATAKVNQMLAILNGLINQFVSLLGAAMKIELAVPDSVVALINIIADLKIAIQNIPTV
jgi:hypothetical protein